MIVGMVDTSTLEGVLRASQRPNRQPRPTPRFVEPTPSPVDFLASNFVRSAPQVAKSAAATNIFNPVPLATEAVNEGRLPTGAEAGLDAGFLAAGFLPVGKALQGLKFINRGSRNPAQPGVRYVEAVLPEAQRVNPEDAVGRMMILPDGRVGQIFVEPNFRRQGIATEMWNYANREGLNPVHSPVADQTAAGKAWIASLGAQAARPALETGEAIAARRNAIMKLLNEEGPNALSWYLGYPMLGYRGEGAEILSKFFRETPERIPAGTQMYRAPSAGQVQPRYGSQSVPLPREVGAEWRPGRVQSTAGSEDLQQLGELLTGAGDTGGGQRYAPGMMQIEAMEDLPGIYNLNDYFESNNAFRGKIPEISSFNRESVLAPQLRYVVRDYVPNSGEGFPTWYLNAYAR